ncbi:unnamed protein product, partial [Amoebophrya sp. A120]
MSTVSFIASPQKQVATSSWSACATTTSSFCFYDQPASSRLRQKEHIDHRGLHPARTRSGGHQAQIKPSSS